MYEELQNAASNVISRYCEEDEETEIYQEHIAVIADKYNFSNEVIHCPGMQSPHYGGYAISSYITARDYIFEVYANGSSQANKGYVSLKIHRLKRMKFFEVICIISVIDASENQRFPMTFTFSSDVAPAFPQTETAWEVFSIDQYIKRETLLKESTELLPNDRLILYIDLTARGVKENIPGDDLLICKSFKAENCVNGSEYYLLLDSLVARYLSEESNYFQRMLTTSMIEKTEGRMKIPKEEYVRFVDVVRIAIGKSPLIYTSVNHIFDVYITADKYDIPIVTETSLCFLKMCLSDHNVTEVLEVADEYSHWNLKEIVQNFFESNIKETGVENGGMRSKQIGRKYKWTYRPIISNSKPYLQFEKITKPHEFTMEPSFDFYH